MDELELAHKEWLVDKQSLINKLTNVKESTSDKVCYDVIGEAIEFIRRGEI